MNNVYFFIFIGTELARLWETVHTKEHKKHTQRDKEERQWAE
jgi:hypothetical protein